ncbi:MAG: class I SAM-dependent methyltransferase [Betaproteobacteria bacterium]|nr:class I SAM-dependent methyltransferase [Betaproteobacteria bacterium]
MLKRLMDTAAYLLFPRPVHIRWLKRNPSSWLGRHYPGPLIKLDVSPLSEKIEELAVATHELGAQPLWTGYGGKTAGQSRRSNDVRTSRVMGNFYASLAVRRKPKVVVEFGTAFGISGMYWLAGIEANQEGVLLTFEPNEVWAQIAQGNLSQISSRFTFTQGTFEDNIDACLPRGSSIDIAFIDAIHTREFVVPQLNLVAERSAPGSLILIDDIEYTSDMKRCWEEIAAENRFAAAATLGSRVGILELGEARTPRVTVSEPARAG